MTKNEILSVAENIFLSFTNYCSSINETDFFNKPTAKWSVAENVQHLLISTKTSTLAYTLPLFLVRWIGGKPNRNSRSFDELVLKYTNKLKEGGAATGRFVPKPVTNINKEKLLNNWKKATQSFLKALKNNRSENELDNYLVKHPLLGHITLRELGYFTIYHTQHHLNNIISANKDN